MEGRPGRCQSCGMPLVKDKSGGGTEADGSKSAKYCGYCYRDGQFLRPGLTVDEMQRTVRKVIRKQGMPWLVAEYWAWRVPRLERWRKD